MNMRVRGAYANTDISRSNEMAPESGGADCLQSARARDIPGNRDGVSRRGRVATESPLISGGGMEISRVSIYSKNVVTVVCAPNGDSECICEFFWLKYKSVCGTSYGTSCDYESLSAVCF